MRPSTRERKVVVANDMSPENIEYSNSILRTLFKAQQDETEHDMLVKQLLQLYNPLQHDLFMKPFTHIIKLQMQQDETSPSAENVLKCCAKFLAELECKMVNSYPMHLIIPSILNWLLTINTIAWRIRFRICQFVSMIMQELRSEPILEKTMMDNIKVYMMERLRDVSQHVRVQAVLALRRLQDPNSNQDNVVCAFLKLISNDPSPKVRQAIITAMGYHYSLMPYILKQLMDVDEAVRHRAYLEMCNFPVRQYVKEQRLTFLEYGLNDLAERVHAVVCDIMIPQWFNSYGQDYVELVVALKPRFDSDEYDMERYRKTAKLVLMEILKKIGVTQMACTLHLEGGFLPSEEMTLERLICWHAMLEYLHNNYSDELDNYMGKLKKFCEYMEVFLENSDVAAVMKTVTLNAENNHTCLPNQPATIGKHQRMYVQTRLQILIEIVQMSDFCDEIGREKLKLLLLHILRNGDLCKINVRVVIDTFERLITNIEARFNCLIDLVNSMLEPSRQDVCNGACHFVDGYFRNHPEMTTLKQQISSLHVKILELKEQKSAPDAQQDYARYRRICEKLNVFSEKYAKLVKPLVHEMKDVDVATIKKCLQICFYLVNNSSVGYLTPAFCELYYTFVSRHKQSEHVSTRKWALKVSIAFSMLYEELSMKTFKLLKQQLINSMSPSIWHTAFTGIFQLLDKYGFAYFGLETEDIQKNGSPTNGGFRHSVNAHSNSNGFYALSIYFMDKCSDNFICSLIVDGYCRLILNGRCTSENIMSHLVLRYLNPNTTSEVQNKLNIFFQQLIAQQRQDLIQKVLLKTLFLVLHARKNSQFANVSAKTLINFVVESTRPTFNNPGVNLHDTIAVSFLKAMKENIRLKKLLKLLSIEILVLDISNDSKLRTKLAITVDKILHRSHPDAKTLHYLTIFRNMMFPKRKIPER